MTSRPAGMRRPTHWAHDGTAYGLGQPWIVSTQTRDRQTFAQLYSYSRTHGYDHYGCPKQEAIALSEAGTYYSKQTYDGFSRPYQTYDAALRSEDFTHNVTEVRYNNQGYAYQWTDVSGAGDTETLTTYLHNTRGRPHLVTTITNGLGAKTVLTYESLSRTEAYARIDGLHATETEEQRCVTWGGARFCWPVQTATLNAADFYRALNQPWPKATDALVTGAAGAPVLELMGPLYVVTRVDSSAPTGADANALSSVCYLYEQAKVQAAGRGLLP